MMKIDNLKNALEYIESGEKQNNRRTDQVGGYLLHLATDQEGSAHSHLCYSIAFARLILRSMDGFKAKFNCHDLPRVVSLHPTLHNICLAEGLIERSLEQVRRDELPNQVAHAQIALADLSKASLRVRENLTTSEQEKYGVISLDNPALKNRVITHYLLAREELSTKESASLKLAHFLYQELQKESEILPILKLQGKPVKRREDINGFARALIAGLQPAVGLPQRGDSGEGSLMCRLGRTESVFALSHTIHPKELLAKLVGQVDMDWKSRAVQLRKIHANAPKVYKALVEEGYPVQRRVVVESLRLEGLIKEQKNSLWYTKEVTCAKTGKKVPLIRVLKELYLEFGQPMEVHRELKERYGHSCTVHEVERKLVHIFKYHTRLTEKDKEAIRKVHKKHKKTLETLQVLYEKHDLFTSKKTLEMVVRSDTSWKKEAQKLMQRGVHGVTNLFNKLKDLPGVQRKDVRQFVESQGKLIHKSKHIPWHTIVLTHRTSHKRVALDALLKKLYIDHMEKKNKYECIVKALKEYTSEYPLDEICHTAKLKMRLSDQVQRNLSTSQKKLVRTIFQQKKRDMTSTLKTLYSQHQIFLSKAEVQKLV